MHYFYKAIVLVVSILLLVFGYYYYQKKHMASDIEVVVIPPAQTLLVANAVPENLKITFSQPVARLAALNQVVEEGIVLTPKLPGTWRFTSDRELLFTPDVSPLTPSTLNSGWIPGAIYRIDFVPSFFMEGVKLNTWHYEFTTPEFKVRTPQANFYQDPQDPALKKAIAQFEFTHPIDKSDFEKRLELVLLTPLQRSIREERTLHFSVVYDAYRSRATVHSESLPIPENDQEVLFRLKAGSRSLLGGNTFQTDLEIRTIVPSLYTGLRIGKVESTFAKNNQDENQRILVIETTTPVKTEVLATHLKIWQLPIDKPALLGRPAETHYAWVNASEIGPEVLETAQVVPVTAPFSEQDAGTLHSFTYTAEADHYVFIRIEKGLNSVGGYILAQSFESTVYQDPFPPEIHLSHQGALLSLTGDKTISVMTRDVKAVQFEVSRVFPNMIHHLVQMTGGRFDTPYFKSSQFSSDNLTERWTYQERVPETPAGTPAFLHFSFSKITAFPTNGLFFLKIQGWDAERKISTAPREERFVLITDLGFLVKDNADGSHDVFVMSLRTGQPESNAEVRILGQNGLPLIFGETDALGHVYFPSMVDFVREQQPLVYVVQKGDDFSFLPYDRGDRKLNFSKFDIDGDISETDPRALDAFIFTDRDLYRPGESAHFGLILKTKNWKETHTGMPFEFVLTDPRGMTIHKERLQLQPSGFHVFDYALLPKALTGTYTASVYLIKADLQESVLIGSHALSVEEFAPDRLKITARFSPEKIVNIELATLFGAPAAQHAVSVRSEMSPMPNSVPGYPDYRFFDAILPQKQFNEKFPNIKTNVEGKANLDLNLSRFAKSSFKLDLFIQGFEGETGRSVNTTLSTLVSPLPYWVGYKPTSRGVHLIAVDPVLRPIQTQNLTLKLLALESVSVLKKQENGTLAYESVFKEKEIKRESLAIPIMGLDYSFSDQKPGNYMLILENTQGLIFNKIAYTQVGKNYVFGRQEPTTELQLSLNKPFGKGSYAPGEWIELQIKAPYHGSGLITLEREKIYAYQWFHTTKDTTLQRIQIPTDLEGNAYVQVSFVRALDSPEIYTGSLSYAVSPFSIETQARTNPIQLTLPEIIHPGETIPIRYQTEFPTPLLIFAVDEGILSAAHYQSPDPISYFFRKRALQVETSQILDLIFPETQIGKSRFAIGGGDGEELEVFLNPFKRKGKPSVVFWSKILTAKETPSEISWTVPDYFDGSLRFIAVAVSPDRMGSVAVSKPLQSDVVLMPHLPAFVAPGDEFIAQATIYNQNLAGVSDMGVTLEPSLSFTVLGKETQRVLVPKGRNALVRFLVKTNSKLGPGNLTFKAIFGTRQIQYQEEISVRPAMPFLTHLTVGAVKASEKELPITRKLFKEKSIRTIGVSSIPLALSQGLVTYLEHYPYACTEQLVSQAFPLVLLEQKIALPTTYTKQDFFNKAIAILQARQNEQGGFGYWAANAAVDPFVSVYATHFLLESEAHGYRVPSELFQSALSYLRLLIEQTEIKTDYNTWAYAIYVLTRAGEVPGDALSALYQALMHEPKETWKNTLAPLYMAATHQLLKQDEWAASFLKDIHFSFASLSKWEIGKFFTEDPLVYAAQSMYLLARHWKERVPAFQSEYFLRLSEALSQQRYHSLSAAYLVLAFDALAGIQKTDLLGTFSVVETMSNRSQRTLNLAGDLFLSSVLGPQAAMVTIQNKNPQYLFYQLTESGFDLELPKKAVKEKLEVIREYRDEQGRLVKTPIVGQKLNVSIKLRALSSDCICDHIAVVDLLPGGLEIDTNSVRGQVSDYIDMREDRIIFFGSVDTHAKEFHYPAYAAYPGTFTVPPILAESMYHRQERAVSVGGSITIEPPLTPQLLD